MEQGRVGDQVLEEEINGGRSTDEISRGGAPAMETSCSDTETSAGSKRNFSESNSMMMAKKARMGAAEIDEGLPVEEKEQIKVKGEPEISHNNAMIIPEKESVVMPPHNRHGGGNCQAPSPDKNDLITPNGNNCNNGNGNNSQIVRKARVSVRARCEAPMVTN